MTRAKEKMILTGTAKLGEEELLALEMMEDIIKREEKQNSWKADEKDSLALYQMEGAKTCFDWILPALMRDWKKAEKWIQVRLVTEKNYPMGQQQQVGQKYWREKCGTLGYRKVVYAGMERASVRTDELYLIHIYRKSR